VNRLGYAFFGDSTYSLSFTFPHSAKSLTLEFATDLFEGKGTDDESWGLDHVKVTTDAGAPAGAPAGSALGPAPFQVSDTALLAANGQAVRLRALNLPNFPEANRGTTVAIRSFGRHPLRRPEPERIGIEESAKGNSQEP
jgi:hypothetical protein